MHHNQIIAVLQEHGFAEGRLIANSKSGYCKRHRSHFVLFNAQVCNIRGRLLKPIGCLQLCNVAKSLASPRWRRLESVI